MKRNKLIKIYQKRDLSFFERTDKTRAYKSSARYTKLIMRCVRNGTAKIEGTISNGYVVPVDKPF